jgi:membrane protein YdbS with pleckstrin-like domain
MRSADIMLDELASRTGTHMPTITLTCDRCSKPFSVDDARVGDKVECPSCRDVQVVREVPFQARADEDRAAAAGFPPRLGPEVDVMRLRPVMFRSHPLKFALVCLGLPGGCIGGIVAFAMGIIPLAVALGVLALISIVVLIAWKVQNLNDGLLITTRRVVDREGILSRNTSEILIKDIRHVMVKQSFVERMFNVGTLALSSASDDGVEISMDHMAKPNDVKRVIDLYR